MSGPVRIWRALTVVAVVLSAAALVASAFTFYDSHSEQDRIRQSQLDSCLRVGDPILTGLVALVDVQIATSRGVSPKLFPAVPPDQFRRLLARQQKRLNKVRRPLVRVPSCQRRYGNQ